MIRRFASLLVLVWLFGFAWFAIALPRPAVAAKTDAAAVFTGGEGRIQRGLEALEEGWAPKLLVSGVDREVKPAEFAAEYEVSERLMRCCVVLGYESYDTTTNALEVSRWLARNRFRSVRLVTSDWHMRRAAYELQRAKPEGVRVIEDAVPTQPSFRILLLEYHKFLARRVSWVWDPT